MELLNDDIDKLVKALDVISKIYGKNKSLNKIDIKQINPIVKLNPRNAFYSDKESVKIGECVNRICGESIMAYPPGIPIISPGEMITQEIIDYIKLLKENNAHLTDMKDKSLETILVIK